MKEQATVRRATAEDAAELARLRWDFSPEERAAGCEPFPRFRESFTRFWRAAAESGGWAVWVAEAGGRLAGNVWVRHVAKVPRPGRPHPEYGYVTNVYVEPELRSRGVGGALLAAAVRGARERGLEFLIVWPSEESVRFYARAGFRPSAEAMELDLENLPAAEGAG